MKESKDVFGAHNYCALTLDKNLRVTNAAWFQGSRKPDQRVTPVDLGQALRNVTGLDLPDEEIGRIEGVCRRLLDNKQVDLAKRSWGWVPEANDLSHSPHKAVAAALYNEKGAPSNVLLVIGRIVPAYSDADEALLAVAPRTREDLIDLARQLAVSLNHEINNPLFVASATLEDVLAEEQDPKVHHRLQTALDAVWKVAESIKLLQNLSEVVSTTYIPGFTMIDLKASSKKT